MDESIFDKSAPSRNSNSQTNLSQPAHKDFKTSDLQDIYHLQSDIVPGTLLTRREIDIVACIINGRSAKKIARLLSISSKTVETHIRNIMLKTDCRSQNFIIDLIEKSEHYGLLKSHYRTLTSYENSDVSNQTFKHNADSSNGSISGVFKQDGLKKSRESKIYQLILKTAGKISKNKVLIIGPFIFLFSGYIWFNIKDIQPLVIGDKKNELSVDSSDLEGKIGDKKLVRWNLPRQDRIFVGREKLLEELNTYLHPVAFNGSKNKPENNGLVISACAGLGGVGKTQLALEYIHNSIHHYTFRAWFPAEKKDELSQIYLEFAKEIGYVPENSSRESVITYVKKWLAENPGWLIVYDNVKSYDDISDFLPDSGGSVLLTTRQRNWPGKFQVLSIDVMSEEESIKLLKSVINRSVKSDENSVMRELARRLGYLPLALSQAGAYIHFHQISVLDYLNLFEEHANEILKDNVDPDPINSDSVAITWNVSLNAIANQTRKFKEAIVSLNVLMVCAYLAPDKISFDTLLAWIKKTYPKQSNPDLILHNVIGQLWQYSLIHNDAKGNVGLHRLMQVVLRQQHRASSQQKNTNFLPQTLEWYNSILESVHNEFVRESSVLEDENRQKSLLPHLLTLVENHRKLWPNDQYNTYLSNILSDIADVFLYHMGNPSEAKPYYERALDIKDKHYGKNDFKSSKVLSNLGITYGYLGKPKKQMELANQVLKIQEKHYGGNHVAVAKALTVLADSYGDLGEVKTQKVLLEKALEIQERHLGKDHFEVGKTLDWLGVAYNKLGDMHKSKELLERSLRIQETFYGKNHLAVGRALDSLGTTYHFLGNIRKGMELLESALKIKQSIFGEKHIFVGITMANLANAYRESGDALQAKDLLEKALGIDEAYFGKNHVEVAMVLTNLGYVYKDLGEFSLAKEILVRALKIDEEFYGENSLEIAKTLTYLASVCQDISESERILKSSPNHQIIKEQPVEKLESNKGVRVENSFSYILLERAIRIKKQYYDENNPEFSKTLVELGRLHNYHGNLEKAEQTLKQAYESLNKYYGDLHPETSKVLMRLANVYKDKGNLNMALELMKRSLAIQEQFYGKEHLFVGSATLCLAKIYIALNEIDKAQTLIKKSLRIFQEYKNQGSNGALEANNLLHYLDIHFKNI